ncbi:MAG TPA: hypothetical protein VM933_01425 [Acidimicrobiales bacterium]|nr:hypothetical protein [Acidimicrobiales bacterium]
MTVGCYPGSFNPPTVAHLAIAAAARSACGLSRVDLVVSRVALGKSGVEVPSFSDRVAVLTSVVGASGGWLGLVVSDAQLLVDLSAGYDVLVLGADKWAQVLDPVFYGGSAPRRDEAVASLPPLAVAPRGGVCVEVPRGLPPSSVVLDVGPAAAGVSSTAVRSEGRIEWMVPEAAAFDRLSGAWTDPVRYRSWSARRS